MPLTEQERLRTVERLRKYPAGLKSSSWGTGPLEDTAIPDGFPIEIQKEYG